MTLALGLGLGLTYGGGAPAVFDPATEDPALWLRGSYGGSPWEGTDSAGTSGTHDFTEAMTPPDVGDEVNGFSPADFSDSKLGNASAQDTFISATAYTLMCLFYARTAATDPGAGSPFAMPAFLTGTSGGVGAVFQFGFTAAGVRAGHYDGTWDSVAAEASVGAWHLAFARFNGTLLEVGVDGGALASVARGSVVGATDGGNRIGQNYDGSAKYDGLIMELIGFRSAKSNAVRAGFRQYCRARYGVNV